MDAKRELIDEILYEMFDLDDKQHRRLQAVLTLKLSEYVLEKAEALPAILDRDANLNLLKKFLIAKKVEGCSDHTIKTYKTQLTLFSNALEKNLLEVTTEDIRLWLVVRETRDKVSKRTLDLVLVVLKSFYNFLENEEYIKVSPARRIKNIKFANKKMKALTDEEIDRLRKACANQRETCLLEFLLSTGCRISEAINVKRADIKNDTVLVLGKGKKYRYVYLNDTACKAVQAFLESRQDDNIWLFTSNHSNGNHVAREAAANTLRAIGSRAGVDECNPHKFRRTFATRALRNGMPIDKVSKLLGHSDTKVTERYLDVSEQELRETHKRYVF